MAPPTKQEESAPTEEDPAPAEQSVAPGGSGRSLVCMSF